MTRTSWSLIVSGCALAGLTACTPRTGSDPGGMPSAAAPRLVDTTELARVPERTFVNGIWVRRPPVDFVRRSVPQAEERPQPKASVPQHGEMPLEQAATAATPAPATSGTSTPTPAPTPTPIPIEQPKPEAAPTNRAPLATPTTADLALELKPERPAVPHDAGEAPAPTGPVAANPSPVLPQVEQPRASVPPPSATAAPAAVVAPAGPAVEAPVYAWSRRSIDEVAGMFAQQVRNEPWFAQARDRLGRPPRVQISSIDDGSQGALGVERFGQSLGIALQQVKGLDLAPGNPPDCQVVGKVRLSDDRRFVQIDLHIIELATKQTLQPFATEVPAAGTGAKAEPGKAGYIP